MSYRKTRIGSVFVLGVCMMALSAPGVSAAAVQGGQPVVNARALNGLGTLAFCWRHDVWTVRDGRVHNMGAGVLPTLSTSGRYVAYMKEGGSSSGTLWVARTDGSGHPVAPLAKIPVTANGYVWLPGTDRLVVAASYWALGGQGQRGHKTWGFSSPGPLETWVASRTLWVTRPGGIAPKPVAAAGYGIYRPEWTAHPDVILYAKGGGLWLVNMSAGHPIQVVRNLLGSTENGQFGFYGHRFLGNEYVWVP